MVRFWGFATLLESTEMKHLCEMGSKDLAATVFPSQLKHNFALQEVLNHGIAIVTLLFWKMYFRGLYRTQ